MKGRWLARWAAMLLGMFGLTGTGWSYYYYVYFNTRNAPFTPIAAKFDVTALANNSVPFFISDQGPVATAPGDSFQAIIAEIRGAADVWNNVGTSGIRLSYGGLFTAGTNESAPGIDVEFSDDIPPGLLAMGGPQLSPNASIVNGPTGLFVPITRSKLYLPRDLSNIPLYGAFASSGEQFFVTMVHELGHTLGLQHTLVSGVMSTLWTSASSKAAPLGQDDIAAISLLYPAGDYLDTVGSISGRVTLNGSGLNLASVVALSGSNPAISTLTNPDGTYQINGLPPGQYFVYVHALPPAIQGESTPDNIVYPTDFSGAPLHLNYAAFATQFYNGKSGGTRDAQQSQAILVSAAGVRSGVDFSVSSRGFVPVFAVRTYGQTQTGVFVTTPPLFAGLQSLVSVTGAGLLQQNNALTPGLAVATLGSAATVTKVAPYAPPDPYVAVYLLVNFTAGPGQKHLLFTTPTDLYVLPAAFAVVNSHAPSIASITPTVDANGAPALLIAGTSFFPDQFTTTRIFFDGLSGVIQQVNADGTLLVTPPPASPGYTATVVALNSDGQSSLFLQPIPSMYTYDPGPAAALTVMPASLAPGADTEVDVVGTGTTFVDGQTIVGFGTSDVQVKKVTVLSPGHLQVLVAPNAFVSTGGISVTTGLGVISQALGNQITATNQAPQAVKSR